ncbi:MAG: haloacid dehalogenase-like hydrolase, partial [Candidatus Puniceispirillaceae bacterium]
MRVGIDIDNTIICYDKAFASLAKKTGFDVPSSASKQEVKAWFHQQGLHEEFTILQGQIYGQFISMAHIFEGVLHFIADAIRQRHQLYLVSHKTKYPIKGDQVDLHEAAINFLSQQNIVCDQKPNAIPFDHVYFEQTL